MNGFIDNKKGLTFDDVVIVPALSDIKSRSDCELESVITKRNKISLPFIASPMDSVVGLEMAETLMEIGAIACIHRFMSIDEQAEIVKKLSSNRYRSDRMFKTPNICAAIGATGDYLNRTYALLNAGCDILLIDVAHGHHTHVSTALFELNRLKRDYQFEIIAGSVATAEGAKFLEDNGADAIRVGIGNGSACSTRVMTGVGVPQVTALEEISKAVNIPIIADGGMRYSGDAAKALSFAHTLMFGSMFAGTVETPGQVYSIGFGESEKKYKIYRGSASRSIKMEKNGNENHVEGVSSMVPLKGTVIDVIKNLEDGIKSSMSYVGAKNLSEFRNKARLMRVSTAGFVEGTPHILGG